MNQIAGSAVTGQETMPDGYRETIQRGLSALRSFTGGFYTGNGTPYEQILRLSREVREAGSVVIGAGAGLSTSAGFTYSGERFQKYFGDFARKYGYGDMYAGGFYPYASLEERWAFWSRNIYINRYMKAPKSVYQDLFELVRNKDYFVLTTNVDHQFQKAGFDKSRLFYTQGDYGLWQCMTPCHERTYDNKEKVVKMLYAQGFLIGENGELLPPQREDGTTDFSRLSMQIPSELVPCCPVCGEPMGMNLRADETFVEDEGWHAASAAYARFLKKHEKGRVLYLELGVGTNTPVIIKYPFWQMTAENPDAVYACINLGEAYAPAEIAARSVCIDGDLGEVIGRSLSVK